MTLQGKLIEYLDDGRFNCAMVLEDSAKRLRILSQNGRESNLPHSRIIHASRTSHPLNLPREELARRLKAAGEKRQALAMAINLEEIWELTATEPANVFTPSFLAELCFGRDTDDDHIAAFLRRIFMDKLFFKYKAGDIVAHPPETVEQQRLHIARELQKESLLTNGADNLMRLWKHGDPGDWPERAQCLEVIRDYYLFGNEAAENVLAKELLKRAQLNGPHDAFHLLVKAGVWGQNENIPLLRQNLSVAFPEKALLQTEALELPEEAALLADGRRDFRHLPLLTIDGDQTRDFDDALHIEQQGDNYLVGIHISDVAHYVLPGTPLFEEAVNRGTSLYFPDQLIPMLPKKLSEEICSLVAGQPRAALSFLVLLSADGEMLEYDLFPSVVSVQRQLRYGESDRLLQNDRELGQLAQLSQKLRQRRLTAGALLLPFPDVNIRIEPDDAIKIGLSEVDTPSRVLVAEFMILANALGAQMLAERMAPGLFRSQPSPRQRLVHGLDKDLFHNILQRKKLSPMSLLTTAKPHSGLGVAQYTTVTSPIRRVLDLLMQLQLKHLVKGKGHFFQKSELKNYAGIILANQNKVNGVKYLRQRYWILKHLESRTGELIKALLIEKGPKRAHLLLVDFLLDADLPAPEVGRYTPGQMLMVRIGRADALDNTLRLEVAGQAPA
ncbi:MAG: hypothetical protein A2521_00685 [Deltaproteobacteria bacterium RIFOXYD12_FULL_57_12]|nr:MAG: hypothetical protein A2521_00685 [Deltaproteobacteria bacterium RIFOXYD12_FULL_57_12]